MPTSSLIRPRTMGVTSETTRFARSLRRRSTEAERRLWYFLRRRGLLGSKFRRQQPIAGYVADFCCPQAGLVIEIDGGQHAARRDADAHRTAELQRAGFRVIRFWNDDVLLRTEAVLETVRSALRTPSP